MSMSLASSGSVKIIHGANDGIFNVVGASVASVRVSLVDAFNIPDDAIAFVNGEQVSGEFRLLANSTVEFVKQRGRKGVGDQVRTEEEFCQLFKITPEDLQAWIAQGLKVRRCLDGYLRITESDTDDFFRGPVVESPYLNIEEAAIYARTTVNNIYGLIERRKLKKLPGTRTVLFTKKILDDYLTGLRAFNIAHGHLRCAENIKEFSPERFMWWLQFEVTEYNRKFKNTPGYRKFTAHNFRDTAMTRAWDANISVDKAAIALGCHPETMKKHYVVKDRMAISDDVLKKIQGQILK